MAQNDVTVVPPRSVIPTRSPALSALWSSLKVQAWVPAKLLLQAELAPGTPSSRL